jgi:HlyD family secretion protein
MSKLPEQTTLHDPYPPGESNGSPHPGASAPPIGSKPLAARPAAVRGPKPSSRRPFWVASLLLLLLGAAGIAFYLSRPDGDRADVITYKVKREVLVVNVTEKGTLESADNRDIVCRVRAGSRGVSTSINWVIADGDRVKPGQLLMILDDSALKEQEDTQSIVVKEKHAAKVKADKDYEIQLKKNESAVAKAETDYVVAVIALDKLTGLSVDPDRLPLAALAGIPSSLVEGGSYKQEYDDLSGQISLARSTVEQNMERYAWASRMVKSSYMSAAQAQAEKSRLDSSMETLRSLEAKLSLLKSHDRRERVTTLTSARDNARRTYEEAKLSAEATEIQFRTDKETKTSVYFQELEKLEDIKRQRKECRITAPDDIREGSMVVYFKNESRRYGSTNDGLIEQGAPVKEGQKMLRIPNLNLMQVNTKVHEAMVGRIRGDVRVPTRIVEFTQAALLLNPDPYARVLATRPDTIEEIRNVYRERDKSFEYKKVRDGQRATIKVDAMPGVVFVGHVRTVAAVASQADWMSSEAKNYQTYVMIEGELLPDGQVVPLEGERLRPDSSAEVTISVDATKASVLTAPIQAVIGGAEMGVTREVFVKVGEGYERREVVLGLYNDKMVEIRSGLNEGDEVVVNPKVLLGEKDKTKTRETGESKEKEYDKNGGRAPGGDPKAGGFPAGPGGPGGPGGDPGKAGFPGGGDPGKGGKKRPGGKGGFPGGGQPPIG